jgi:hypothetical protein
MSERTRGAASRLLHGLANAIVERALPRVRTWLKERLGPRADVGAAELDGTFIHLDDVRIPLGGEVLLVVRRATVTMSPAGIVQRGAPEIRLYAMEGEVRLGLGDAASESSGGFRAPVRFVTEARADGAEGEAADRWVDGRLLVEGARWPVRTGHGDQAPLVGEAHVIVDANGWELSAGAFTAGAARIGLAARGDLGDDGGHAMTHARIDLEGARAGHFVDAMRALLGARAHGHGQEHGGGGTRTHAAADALLGVPWDARLTGHVAYRTGTADAALTAETTRSRLTLTAAMEGAGAGHAGPTGHAALAGRLALAEVGVSTFAASDLVLDAIDLTARADAGAPIAIAVTATLDGAPVTLEATGGLAVAPNAGEPRARGWMRWEAASGRLLGQLAQLGGMGDRVGVGAWSDRAKGAGPAFYIPAAAVSSGVVSGVVDEGGTLRVADGRIELAHGPSRLVLGDVRADRTHFDAELTGELTAADAVDMGLFPGEIRLDRRGVVAGRLHVGGPYADMAIAGEVRATALGVVFASRPDVPPLALQDLAATLRLDRRAFVYEDLRGAAYGGGFVAGGTVRFFESQGSASEPAPPVLDLHLRDADARLLEALGKFSTATMTVAAERAGETRGSRELWIPRALRTSGAVTMQPDGSTAGDVAFESSETALLVRFAMDPRFALQSGSVRGRLGVGDALVFGLFDTPIRPRPVGHARIDAELGGTLFDVFLGGTATSERLEAGFAARPDLGPFVLEKGSVTFRVDTARTVWSRARAEGYGGEVTSSGMLGYGPAFTGLQATLAWKGIRVDALPLVKDARGVGRYVRGRLAGDLRFDRAGTDAAGVTAKGDAHLEDGQLPATDLLGPHLVGFGLYPPGPRAREDLTVALTMDHDGWRATAVRVVLDGASFTGHGAVTFEGSLTGRGVVILERDYLARSAVLALPVALVGDVEVPFELAGTVAAPRVETGLAAVLGRMLRKNAVTSAVVDAFRHLSHAIPAPFGGHGDDPRDANADAELDAICDRILRAEFDAAEEDRLIQRLVEAGYGVDEIERAFERRRRRATGGGRAER